MKKLSELTTQEAAERYFDMKKKEKKYWAKVNARNKLLLAKAAKAGVTVTDAEVDAEIKRTAKK